MIFKLITGAIIAGALAIGIFLSGPQTQAPLAGSFSPTGGGTYRLGQSIGTSDSSFKLSSFKEPVSNIPYTMSYLSSDIGYGTISPQSSISEFVSFTGITQNADGSATLTGVARGISRTPGSGGCVASTTLAQSHAGQSIFILSNQPCFYVNEYVPLRTIATSSAVLTFGSTTPPRLDYPAAQSTGTYISTTTELATIAYVNAISIAGAANSTPTVKGLVQLATALQAASSTNLGSTGASDVLQSKYATDTPQNCSTPATGGCVVMSLLTGKLTQAWLDLTASWSFTGAFNVAATTANKFTLNTLAYVFPSTRAASSTVLSEDGSGNLTFEAPSARTFTVDPTANVNNQSASTTVKTIKIAANTFNANNVMRLQTTFRDASAGNCAMEIDLGTGSASTTLISGQSAQRFWNVETYITASTTAEEFTTSIGKTAIDTGVGTTPGASTVSGQSAYATFNNAAVMYLSFVQRDFTGSAFCGVINVTEEVLTNSN